MGIELLYDKYEKGQEIQLEDVDGLSVDELVNVLEDIGVIADRCKEYGEPGYKNPKKEILLGDWNALSVDVNEKIESAGYALEWFDEWVCDDEGAAFRTQPDGPEWEPSYFIVDSVVYPIRGNEEFYIEEVLLNNTDRAAPTWLNLEEYGFEKVTEAESGFYESCNNKTPKELVDKYINEEDFVFKIESKNPWCIQYSLWKKQQNKGGDNE